MPFLLCTLPFGGFSGQHIFHQFRQQTFFSDHIFQMVRPLDGLDVNQTLSPFQLDRPAYSN